MPRTVRAVPPQKIAYSARTACERGEISQPGVDLPKYVDAFRDLQLAEDLENLARRG